MNHFLRLTVCERESKRSSVCVREIINEADAWPLFEI